MTLARRMIGFSKVTQDGKSINTMTDIDGIKSLLGDGFMSHMTMFKTVHVQVLILAQLSCQILVFLLIGRNVPEQVNN